MKTARNRVYMVVIGDSKMFEFADGHWHYPALRIPNTCDVVEALRCLDYAQRDHPNARIVVPELVLHEVDSHDILTAEDQRVLEVLGNLPDVDRKLILRKLA